MRTDKAHEILGLRVNVWTSVIVFLLGLAIVWANRNASRPDPVPPTTEPSQAEPSQEERTSG